MALWKDKVAPHRKWHTPLAGLLFPPGCQGDGSDERQVIYHLHVSLSQPCWGEDTVNYTGPLISRSYMLTAYYTLQFTTQQKTALKYWNDHEPGLSSFVGYSSNWVMWKICNLFSVLLFTTPVHEMTITVIKNLFEGCKLVDGSCHGFFFYFIEKIKICGIHKK